MRPTLPTLAILAVLLAAPLVPALPTGPSIPTMDLGNALPQEPFARAVAMAVKASEWQARAMGLALPVPAPTGDIGPGAALTEVAARQGTPVGPEAGAGLAALDALPAPVRGALGAFLAAYLAFDAAARQDQAAPSPTEQRARVAAVLATRVEVLHASLALRDALAARPAGERGAAPRAEVPGAFVVDLRDTDDVYRNDVALLVDAGGRDAYLNNAGGAGLGVGPTESCGALGIRGAAALLDLGPGDDVFGDAAAPRSCGANGGADLGGVGLLVSEQGDDRYFGGRLGTNGGASRGGVGLLLDGSGNDVAEASEGGVNGGGEGDLSFQLALGALVDAGGDDVRVANGHGANGGAWSVGGGGVLLDDGGDDVYLALDRLAWEANGGASQSCLALPAVCAPLAPARALLADLGGNDHYMDHLLPGGSCDDCTVVPKSRGVSFGAQLDLAAPQSPVRT